MYFIEEYRARRLKFPKGGIVKHGDFGAIAKDSRLPPTRPAASGDCMEFTSMQSKIALAKGCKRKIRFLEIFSHDVI